MTGSETELEPRLLPRLTSFRAYAAFGVFLAHIDNTISWAPTQWLGQMGTTGVTFFFVLSGFVLTWSIRGDSAPWRFYRRRFARIYPAALVSGLIAAVLIADGAPDLRGGLLGAVTTVLLVQAWFVGAYPTYAYNGVEWTLSCEAFFYALLPFIVRVARGWRSRVIVSATIGAVGTGLAATIVLIHFGHRFDIAYTDPLVRLPEFMAGVGLALLVLRGWRPTFPLWGSLLLLGAGAAAAHHWPSYSLMDYFMLPGFIALISSGVGADLRARPGFLASRPSVFLGELSFCFYLVHSLVNSAFITHTDWHHHRYSLVGGLFRSLILLAVSLVAAVLLRQLVELPMQRRLRPRAAATVAATASGGDES